MHLLLLTPELQYRKSTQECNTNECMSASIKDYKGTCGIQEYKSTFVQLQSHGHVMRHVGFIVVCTWIEDIEWR